MRCCVCHLSWQRTYGYRAGCNQLVFEPCKGGRWHDECSVSAPWAGCHLTSHHSLHLSLHVTQDLKAALTQLEATECPRPTGPKTPSATAAAARNTPSTAGPSSSTSTVAGASSAPVAQLKRGAPDLRAALGKAQAAGAVLVVVWLQSGSDGAASGEVVKEVVAVGAELRGSGSAAAGCGVMVMAADVGASAANGALAAALKVTAMPTLHVYQVGWGSRVCRCAVLSITSCNDTVCINV